MNSEYRYPIVSVTGLCATGSSAVFDLLREYDTFESFPYEFRLLTDPDGIIDLGNVLKNNWQDLNVDIAIRRFIALFDRISRDTKWYYPLSYGYNALLDGRFEKELNVFLKNMGCLSWQGSWPYHWHEYSAAKWFFYRVLAKFKKEKWLYRNDKMYMASFSQFEEACRVLFNNICKIIAKDKDGKQILFDQLIPAGNCEEFLTYFYDAKIIIVDRDPRDVYTRGVVKQWPFIPTPNIDNYIAWYRTIRENTYPLADDSKRILFVRFEDLIYKYEETKTLIEEFIHLNPSQQIRPREYFKPEVSIKNTQSWHKMNPDAITQIEKELKEYCYPFK